MKLYPLLFIRSSDGMSGFLDSGYSSNPSTTNNNLLINKPETKEPHKPKVSMTKNMVLNKCKKIYL